MKLSRYIKIFPFEKKPGYLLLYSTKKASMVLVKEETFDSIAAGTLSPEKEAMLLKLGMVVPDGETEKREVTGFMEEINRRNSGLNISVILNLDCNFDCIYCYESGMKGKLYMNDGTAGLLTAFIKERFTPGKKSLNIDFYGGEPLLSTDLIKSVSAEMKSFAQSRGASYTFTLVTNGSLFKRRIAEDLVSMGLKGVKITIDGPPETHNACRPFKSGAGSFDTIIKNIKETCDIVNVAVGGNFQKDNFEKFPLLMDHLQHEGLTPERIYELKFDPVMNRADGDRTAADYTDGAMTVNEPWVIQAGTSLREQILKRGYRTPKITPSPCQVEITDSFVVNFDGVIYKCPVFIGKDGFSIGDLRNGVRDYTAEYKPGIWKNEKCVECGYLPLCFGGCRYMSYVRDGNIDHLDCKRAYFDATLEDLVRQDIQYIQKTA
ncbi:MAG: putative geopeptide radical SAM maturase [Deferribacteres bacterium]|nr:putative geopeptide radical SAM maturase [Deferribacteres bacterium]